MKKIVLLLILLLGVVNLYSQTETDKKQMTGAHFAFGSGEYFTIGGLGGGSYNTKYYYSVGFKYLRELSKRWDLYSGLEYTYVHMMIIPEFPGAIPFKQNLKFVTIPVHFKYNLWKFVYLNGSISAVSDGYSIGMFLGCGTGFDLKYKFDSGIMLIMNPYVRFNSNIHYNFLQEGVSLGVLF